MAGGSNVRVTRTVFAVGYVGTIVLFVCCGLALIVFRVAAIVPSETDNET